MRNGMTRPFLAFCFWIAFCLLTISIDVSLTEPRAAAAVNGSSLKPRRLLLRGPFASINTA